MHSITVKTVGDDVRLKYLSAELARYRLFADGAVSEAVVFAPNKRLESEDVEPLPFGTVVFANGATERARQELHTKNGILASYSDNASFLEGNAKLTAEATLSLLMERSEDFFPQNILVVGYGRIGKHLCRLLCSCGTRFAIATRYPEKVGEPIRKAKVEEYDLSEFDVLINTAPHLIFDQNRIASFAEGCVYLELASPPYGIDLEAAKLRGISVSIEKALPSRYSPERAASLITDLMKNYFEFI